MNSTSFNWQATLFRKGLRGLSLSLAITSLTPQLLAQNPAAQESLDVQLPIRWDMTRNSVPSSVATESETFAENWRFIKDSNRRLFLSSPRATVKAFHFSSSDKLSQLPSKLLIQYSDMAELLGIKASQAFGQNHDVIINLSPDNPPPFKFQMPEEATIQVNLRVHY